MSSRSPENLVNVGAIAFLLDTKTHVEPMGEHILVKKLENGVMILLMDTPLQCLYNIRVIKLQSDKYVACSGSESVCERRLRS